jgi:predicted LPLAT superfamily acyltransferase
MSGVPDSPGRGPTRATGEQPWARAGERGSPMLIRFIIWVALTAGRRTARLLLHPITLYFLVAAPGPARHSRAFLARALGRRPGLADRYRHIHSFASVLLDRVFFMAGRMSAFELSFDGLEALEEAHAKGRGVVLVGAHFGSFEAMRALAASYDKARLKVLMREGPDARIADALRALDPTIMEDVIPLGDARSMLRVNEWLRQGGMVGMLGDRVPHGDKTLSAPFLGARAAFPTSPWLLASVTKAPVVMFAAIYLGGNRYMIRFRLLAEGVARPRRQDQAGFEGHVALYADTLQDWVRETPYNWFNFYDFWA